MFGNRRDILEAERFAIRRRKRQKIWAVGLGGLGRLFGFENKYSFLLAIEHHHCARILQASEIIEIVVFAIVDRFGNFVASEQYYGAGLATLRQFRAASSERLRSAEVVNRLPIRILRHAAPQNRQQRKPRYSNPSSEPANSNPIRAIASLRRQ